MTLTNYTVKRQGKEWIGDSVVRLLNQLSGPYQVVAVIPKLLAYFSQDRYEVVEVDLIISEP